MPRSMDDRNFELFSSPVHQERTPGSLQCRVELAKLEHQEHQLKAKGSDLKARNQQLKSLLGMRQ